MDLKLVAVEKHSGRGKSYFNSEKKWWLYLLILLRKMHMEICIPRCKSEYNAVHTWRRLVHILQTSELLAAKLLFIELQEHLFIKLALLDIWIVRKHYCEVQRLVIGEGEVDLRRLEPPHSKKGLIKDERLSWVEEVLAWFLYICTVIQSLHDWFILAGQAHHKGRPPPPPPPQSFDWPLP
ncbi:hypothetical protein Ddye_008656 [Dipteronia dyeriana]|uniref:Uncharacterized protein n=1 Tax=Dipteronia dyeriana TaxID=168575 RepID=A0AAD9XA57_9ROSI|nr:hypothetical protein Ddye_008656 [Dipteronia dyeriana]